MVYRTGQKWKLEYKDSIHYTATILGVTDIELSIKDRKGEVFILNRSKITNAKLLEDSTDDRKTVTC